MSGGFHGQDEDRDSWVGIDYAGHSRSGRKGDSEYHTAPYQVRADTALKTFEGFSSEKVERKSSHLT
jgi:hypothetical protein